MHRSHTPPSHRSLNPIAKQPLSQTRPCTAATRHLHDDNPPPHVTVTYPTRRSPNESGLGKGSHVPILLCKHLQGTCPLSESQPRANHSKGHATRRILRVPVSRSENRPSIHRIDLTWYSSSVAPVLYLPPVVETHAGAPPPWISIPFECTTPRRHASHDNHGHRGRHISPRTISTALKLATFASALIESCPCPRMHSLSPECGVC